MSTKKIASAAGDFYWNYVRNSFLMADDENINT